FMELFYFIPHNNAASTAIHFNMRDITFFKQVHHIFKILHMTALVRANGNPLHVLLNSAVPNLFDRPVVTQMHDLGSAALQDSAHNIYTGIMPVKKAGRGYKPNIMLRFVYIGLFISFFLFFFSFHILLVIYYCLLSHTNTSPCVYFL